MNAERNRPPFMSQKGPGVSLVKPEVNERHEKIRKDIATRLRRACSDMSEEDFAALVDKMLKVQLAAETRWH